VAVLVIGAAVGVVLTLSKGKDQTDASGERTPSPGPTPTAQPTLEPPAGLTATLSGFVVVLRWTHPPSDIQVNSYTISRDGHTIGSVPGTAISYQDATTQPGNMYAYSVRADGVGGVVASTPDLQVAVARPPIGESRMAGIYNVVPTLVSSYGFTSFRPVASYGFRLTPKCRLGACAEVLAIEGGPKPFKIPLTRSGAAYQGSATGAFDVTCGSAHPDTTVSIELRVTRAADVGGSWETTKFVGTLTQATPSQFGCVSSKAVESLVGTA
jgi:hypothetical protein